eukprot:scaffold10100_cov93-Skeletonema_marinoi.AAC.3
MSPARYDDDLATTCAQNDRILSETVVAGLADRNSYVAMSTICAIGLSRDAEVYEGSFVFVEIKVTRIKQLRKSSYV